MTKKTALIITILSVLNTLYTFDLQAMLPALANTALKTMARATKSAISCAVPAEITNLYVLTKAHFHLTRTFIKKGDAKDIANAKKEYQSNCESHTLHATTLSAQNRTPPTEIIHPEMDQDFILKHFPRHKAPVRASRWSDSNNATQKKKKH